MAKQDNLGLKYNPPPSPNIPTGQVNDDIILLILNVAFNVYSLSLIKAGGTLGGLPLWPFFLDSVASINFLWIKIPKT